ncbi:hypothetical protein GWI33_004440 [Rhynchophorus ferrugineus]|uniref:Uncharacterized protein n=1 Tax=Rhynchophorus ferrugineus TaxID=354439 RepID=A0A834MIS7_RHYFE|nr:hypothetical protein GWI33_004440 [Rhynchophorus ferrugineus]
MLALRSTIFIIVTIHLVQCTSLKDVFTDSSKNIELSIVRIPRKADDTQVVAEKLEIPLENVGQDSSIVRKARDSKYFSDRYGSGTKASTRSLKPEDNAEDGRSIKGNGSLEKRCSTCDTGYLKSTSFGTDRWRDRFDRYDRDPYSSSRFRYDPYDKYDRYDRYDRDRYYDGYDDYDKDFYRDSRGRNRYSSYYEPRDRYSDRGIGYDNRGYDYRDYRNSFSPYYRDRYDGYYSPSEDYYVRGYDSLSRGYYTRPDYGNGYSGGYARGYSYGGDRNRLEEILKMINALNV